MSAAEAPAPVPGQRWLDGSDGGRNGNYDIIGRDGDGLFAVRYERSGNVYRNVGLGTFTKVSYLGPTPGYVPSPATPTPAAAPPTVAGVGGPPKGYVQCPENCGRYTAAARLLGSCWHCWGVPQSETYKKALASSPDWTPPAAPPTREQILVEELRGVGTDAPGTVRDSRMVAPKTAEETARELATIQRVRAHQLAEGGPSATAKAPGKAAPPPFIPSVDEWDLLADADAAPVRYRR